MLFEGLFNALGFTQEASNAITDDQGIDSTEEMQYLTDSEVENLCAVVRKPGGTIANPAPGARQPQNIPNPGIPVALHAENNLKLACYFLRHQIRIQRPAQAALITIPSVRALKPIKEFETPRSQGH